MQIDTNVINQLLRTGQPQQALHLLSKKNLKSKQERFLRTQRASLYLHFRVYDKAITDCLGLEKYKDTRYGALLIQAKSQLGQLNYTSAKRILAKLHSINKNSNDLHKLLTRFKYETASYVSLLKHTEKLEHLKANATTIRYRINAMIALGKYQQAADCLEQLGESINTKEYISILASLKSQVPVSLPSYSSSDTTQKYSLGIITPVGPGHDEILQSCKTSIETSKAFANNKIFSNIRHYVIDDSRGKLGRSKARNIGIALAEKDNIDWVFFLDADDTLAENAFINAAPHLNNFDFIWGGIYSGPFGGPFHYRINQIPFVRSINQYIANDPFLTFQMGHFARLSCIVEQKISFDESLDCGEDVRFYLSEIEHNRFIKTPLPLFYNIRGKHSEGPRSASGTDWNKASAEMIQDFQLNKVENNS